MIIPTNYTRITISCLFLMTVLLMTQACGKKQAKISAHLTSERDQKEMVLVPSGMFIMGTDKVDPDNTHRTIGTVKPLFLDQHPQKEIYLDAYYIDKYEVTNKEYKRFLEATQYIEDPAHWNEGSFPEGKGDHPVTNVTWTEALAYALWAGKNLPTEAQWEKAARGTDGRLYPWGNEYQKGNANIGIEGDRKTAKVGSYPQDVSPFRAYDMSGNVMEWTLNWYMPYPGNDYKHARFGTNFKVLRGNAFQKAGHYFLEAYRYLIHRTEVAPDQYFENVGFRCVLEVEIKPLLS